MALISCPECNRDVSDSAVSCPHCGFSLSTARKVVTQTRSSKVKKSNNFAVVGVLVVAIGLFMVYEGIFVMPAPLSWLLAAVGLFFMAVGSFVCVRKARVDCPYCSKENIIRNNASSMTCRFCKKTSVRENDEMKTVD